MINRLKKFLNKHKNRIVAFTLVFVCIPCFSVRSYADEMHQIGTPFYRRDGQSSLSVYLSNNTWKNYGMSSKVDDFNGKWSLGNDSGKRFKVYFDPDGWTIPYFSDYDYFLNVTLTNMSSQIKINDIAVIRKSSSGTEVNMSISDKQYGVSTYGSNMGYYVTCKLNALDVNSTIGSLNLVFDNTYAVGNEVRISYIVYAVPKSEGATSSDISALITAINNQTTTLNGSIGSVNSSIQSGTSTIDNSIHFGNGSTSGIVGNNNSAVDNLDSVVSEYRETEQAFFDDFNTNQQAITNDIVGWSWGGLVNCADWVGSTLTDYYNNMGDFRQYIIYPLMLGIALFFLGRGGSIIGHLFRKPTQTTVNTKSVFRREGNTRYTTTTTSRQGGVFRR